jgi:hypothetical protein
MENKNLPAFPTLTWDQLESGQIVQETESEGLSKREVFAMAAMQGLLAGRWSCPDNVDCSPETIAPLAVKHADALIAELSKA